MLVRSFRTAPALFVPLVALVSACGLGDKAANEGAEALIESAAGEQEIDVELGEDGEFKFGSADGSVAIEADADGNVNIKTPDGTASMAVGDDGSIDAQSDAGDFSLDAEGNAVVESNDGSVVFGSNEIPDSFPDEIRLPEGYEVDSVIAASELTNVTIVVDGGVGDIEALMDEVAQSLADAGYTDDGAAEQAGIYLLQYTGETEDVAVAAAATDAGIQLTYTIIPAG